jgi:hypothetical protein
LLQTFEVGICSFAEYGVRCLGVGRSLPASGEHVRVKQLWPRAVVAVRTGHGAPIHGVKSGGVHDVTSHLIGRRVSANPLKLGQGGC